LLARAGRGELRRPDDPTVVLSPFFLIDLAEQGFRGPHWADLAQALGAMTATTTGPGPASAAAEPLTDPAAVPFPGAAIFCADYDLPVRDHAELASHLRASAALAPDMRYGTFAVYGTVACLGWPKPVANPQHRLQVRRTDTPLLLVNALHDPATSHT
jgi:hypothetical protein